MSIVIDENHIAVPQGSAVWFENRLGRLTASGYRRVKRLRTGEWSKDTLDYVYELVSERLTNVVPDRYVTPAMQWGKDHEAAAKRRYAELTGVEGRDVGLFHHPKIEFLAASPDWVVDPDGLVEFKAPTSTTHARWLDSEECPPDYHGQMLVQLACTGRSWCDFVSFDPRMPIAQQMRIWRFEPTREQIQRIEEEAVEFLELVEAAFERVTRGAA